MEIAARAFLGFLAFGAWLGATKMRAIVTMSVVALTVAVAA